jgi:hypothetical protein
MPDSRRYPARYPYRHFAPLRRSGRCRAGVPLDGMARNPERALRLADPGSLQRAQVE